MSGETEALLAKARRSLDNARRSLEALLLSRGLVFSKHGAVIAEFSREFVRSGEFAAEYGRALREALEERIVADYQAGEDFPTARGQKLLMRAEAFVAAAQAFLDRPNQ